MNGWYENLHKPPLTPPDWIFSPVWTVLYIMIAVSLFLYWKAAPRPMNRAVLLVLGVHIVTNLVWTYLFFGLQSPLLAFLDILLLDATLIVVLPFFWQVSRPAAVLLLPYLLWVLFASYLNAGFLYLN